MKELLLGNAAVARGLYESGCKFISSYPGTPSTEITEEAVKYSEIYSEWAPNEKVAAESAFGACLSGVRSFCAMKHVGLNVAADLLYTASYTGVNGGFVLAVADDPGMHSSQNEQDSRRHAIGSKVPMLEPSDSQECLSYIKKAYEISEQFDTPVILRLTTRIAHSRSLASLSDRVECERKEYKKDPRKYVMMPASARGRHVFVEERTRNLVDFADTSDINTVIEGGDIGVITSGIAYQYAREALGDAASYLKLGMVNPLPEKLIKDFAAKYEKIYVIEELDGVIEEHCKVLGIDVLGKEIFSYLGEYKASDIAEKILGKTSDVLSVPADAPVRPPVLCPGCPHRGLFYVLSKLKLYVSGDIGCYTLAAQAPLSAMDTTICMGASVSALHGFNKADEDHNGKSVAVLGDSTFIHSGITSLINTSYNNSGTVTVILDNSITGMTGHQQNPSTGFNIKGEPASKVDLEALCKAVGIENVTVTDPFDIENTEKVIKEALSSGKSSVVIARRPCALLKSVKQKPCVNIDTENCRKCGLCFKMGCPAIKKTKDGKASLDKTLCTGCGLCAKVCKFGVIEEATL